VRDVALPAGDPGLPSISVVICAYTDARWDDLRAAIASVHAQRQPAHQTILVIDHNEQLRDRAGREIEGVVLAENVEQRGLSGARNSGVRAATGDVVAFIDDDACAEPGWLANLAAAYADPSVLGVGGAIIPAWEKDRPAWWPDEFDWVVGCTYRGMPATRAAVRNMIGCNMSFRRETFEEVGGFPHGIGRIGSRPLGGEETELCIRALRRWPDRQILYEPAAIVHHRVPPARGTFWYFRSRCYSEGLSKAAISRLVGSGSALSTERSYTMRTLSRGVRQNVADGARHPRGGGMRRAAAIVVGLTATTAGYVMGRMGHPREHQPRAQR